MINYAKDGIAIVELTSSIAIVDLVNCGLESGMYTFIRIAVRRSNTDMELYMSILLESFVVNRHSNAIKSGFVKADPPRFICSA